MWINSLWHSFSAFMRTGRIWMFYWSLEILLISRSLSPSMHARSHRMARVPHSQSARTLLVLLGSPRHLLLSFPSLPSFPRNDTVRFWNISFSVGTCFEFPLCLSVSLLRGPHRGMTCVRFVRTGWPESLENTGWQDRSSISTRTNARGRCKTSLLETLGGKTKTWIIAVQSSRYALGLWQCPRLKLPKHPVWCTSNALAKKGKQRDFILHIMRWKPFWIVRPHVDSVLSRGTGRLFLFKWSRLHPLGG